MRNPLRTKKQVDAQEPARRDAGGEVVQNDSDDRYAPQAVERAEMPQLGAARRCHGGGDRHRLCRRSAVEPNGLRVRLGQRDSPPSALGLVVAVAIAGVIGH